MSPSTTATDGAACPQVMSTRYNPFPAERVRVPLYPVPWSPAALLQVFLEQELDRGNEERVVHRAEAAVGAALGGRAGVMLVSSGTAALTLALRALKRGAEDEVILSAFNCPSVAEAVCDAGMVPVFCDVGAGFNLDVQAVRPLMRRATRAVLMTHVFGLSVQAGAMQQLCDEAGVALVDDAAQSFGVTEGGRPLGTWGDFGVLSFGRHKPLFAGGGGALVARDESVLQPFRRQLAPASARRRRDALTLLAKDRASRASSSFRRSSARYTDVVEALNAYPNHGEPARMDGLTARLLLTQVPLLEHYRARARALASRLMEGLRGSELVSTEPAYSDGFPNFFTLLCAPEQRHALATHLAHQGIETTWLYYPLHRLSRYRGYARSELPRCDALWPCTLCIPCRGWHDEAQVDHVIRALRSFRAPTKGQWQVSGRNTGSGAT